MNPSEANLKQMYRIADAVVVLSLGRTAIYEQIRSGRLRSVTQGAGPPRMDSARAAAQLRLTALRR